MGAIAYLYQDSTWEPYLEPSIWGWELDRVYQDLDPQRPQLAQLLQDCDQQPPHYLLLRRLEELGDSLTAVTHCLTDLEVQGICVITIEQDYRSSLTPNDATAIGAGVEEQQFPIALPSSLQLLELLDAVQQTQRSRKIRHGHARNRLKSKPPPGRAPYGYRRGKDRYVVDRSVAPIIKAFFEHFLLYGSLRGAVRYLAQKYGKKISVSSGQRWLTSPVYRGDLVYQKQAVIPNTHPPLLDREEAAQVDRLLRRNRGLSPRAASAPRSLAGLVRCANCQSPMTISRATAPRRPKEYLYVRPTACPQQPKCRALAYEKVLDKTIQQICSNLPLAVSGVETQGVGRVKAALEQEIATKQQILMQLSGLIETQVLDQTTADLRAYRLKTEIATLKGRLSQLPPLNLQDIAKTVSIQPFWLDLSESERRFYFREFIRHIDLIRDDKDWSVQLVFMF